jgi:hypothetical protein
MLFQAALRSHVFSSSHDTSPINHMLVDVYLAANFAAIVVEDCLPFPSDFMESRRHKRLRSSAENPDEGTRALQKLVHLGNITNSALHKVLRQVEANGAIPTSSIHKIGEANLAMFFGVRSQITLDMVDGSTFQWEVSDPNRLFSHLAHECPRLAHLVAEAVRKHPCSESNPWDIVIGFDEFTPGNLLHPNNARKAMALSYSFLQLGQEALWHETSWMTPVVVRSAIIGKAVGGWSAMLKAYIHLHLFGTTGITTSGLPIEINGEVFVIWARLSHIVADGDGLRQAYEWKGAAGLKPCLRHWNVLKLNSDLAHRDSSFVEINCRNDRLFRKTEPSELFEMVDAVLAMRAKVLASTLPKVRLETLQKNIVARRVLPRVYWLTLSFALVFQFWML